MKNFMVSLLILLCIAISNCDYQVLSHSILLLFISSFIGMIITLFAYREDILNRSNDIIKMIIIFLIWSMTIFGTILYINKVFDTSKECIVSAKTIDKEVYAGRESLSPDYSVYVPQWTSEKVGDRKLSVDVPKDVYNEINIGDEINIGVKKGFFNISYYYFKSIK
ncbi:MAG: hypothetical protein EOM05_00370 [Clostridia bacterium]|nr:hypothetical protein [Clostridia bacterium]